MSQKKEAKETKDKWEKVLSDAMDNETEKKEQLIADDSDETHEHNKTDDAINVLEKQVTQYQDEAIRARAELENMRRRMEQEVAKSRKFGIERIVAELVPVEDSLTRGLNDEAHNDIDGLRKGMELTLGLLNKVLKNNGVETITPEVGELFNPLLHEAMSTQKNPGTEPHVILQVLQKGYTLNGRLIRAAMVIVSA
ncbi:MAG TPA: nucleotide exchange factor GrpE [Coxiellaceae bacterium]|nr:nucleotide exchange factor GrpE [Coxiellaceae bacterium]